MAQYHCTAKAVSRGKGQSVVAKAAYNARDKLVDHRTGETKDYSHRKGDVLFSGIFAPKDAPEWAHDREQLWNRVEGAEDRFNRKASVAQLAREVEIALPHELTDEQRKWLVTDYVRENFQRRGMVADVAIHAPSKDRDERNYHAHILLTMRRLDGEEFSKDKELQWNKREQLARWKEDLALKGARMLQREGFEQEAQRFRWGHLTLPQQRAKAMERGDLEFAEACNRSPSRHRGPQVDAMEREGIETDRGKEAREAKERDAAIKALQRELAEVKKQIRTFERSPVIENGIDQAQWDIRIHYAAIENEKTERRFAEPAVAAKEAIRQAHERSNDVTTFRAELSQEGLWVARADLDDVAESKFNHGRLEREGRYAPVRELGEYVAVNSLGKTFTLDSTSMGASREDIAAFLGDLDPEPIPSIGETRAEFLPSRIEREPQGPRASEGYERGSAPGEGIIPLERGATRALGKLFDMGADGVETTVNAALNSFESLFAPAQPERTKSMSREQSKPDLKRYLADDEYRRAMAAKEIEERKQREREYYMKQKEREPGGWRVR